jgi:ribonuclease E
VTNSNYKEGFSMTKEMLINADTPENIRVAIVDQGRLDAFFEDSAESSRTRGNIYLGKIDHVQPGLEACFVDYGEAKHGFLPFSEMHNASLSSSEAVPAAVKKDSIKKNQPIIVQVEKEPIGSKGARLTAYLSLAGRYLVLMPYSDTRGVSRKIEDEQQRKKYKEIGSKLSPPKGIGFIIRTAGLGRTKRELDQDMNTLFRLWKDIVAKARKMTHPGLLHTEADVVLRALRDYYTNDITKVWIDDASSLRRATQFFKIFMPRQCQCLSSYGEKAPLFSTRKLDEQIEAIHKRRVSLPSGGSLVIEQTEALVSIDVNSGKGINPRGQEETAYETNLEAASEIARQLRLRDLGGIVVIDFIDMQSSVHNQAIEKKLREALRSDKARHEINKISSFGLCTLTRQRLGPSSRSIGTRICPVCEGEGLVYTAENMAMQIKRKILARGSHSPAGLIRIRLHPEVANHLHNHHRAELLSLEKKIGCSIHIQADPLLSWSDEFIEMTPPAPGGPPHGSQPASLQAPQTLIPGTAAKPSDSISDPTNQKTPPATTPERRKRRRRPRRGSRHHLKPTPK